jgi:hypothetical protein
VQLALYTPSWGYPRTWNGGEYTTPILMLDNSQMPHNKQMQRARTDHKCVLGYAHRRVADAER